MDDLEIVEPCPKRVRIDAFQDLELRTYTSGIVYTSESDHVKPKASSEPVSEPVSESDSEADEPPPETQQVCKDAEDFYQKYVMRTRDACIAEATAPQRSDAWLNARKHVITASNFGAAAGHNTYQTPKALAIDKVWNTFQGNAFTAYGTFHENDARLTFEALLEGPLKSTLQQFTEGTLLDYHLFETGLLKHWDQPWMGVSPDGILRIVGTKGITYMLVEFKCPARLRDTQGHPYIKSSNCIPEYYMDQMQGIMGFLNKFSEDLLSPSGPMLGSFFVVWQPHQVHVSLVHYKKDYYDTVLEPALENWYFKEYLPLAVLCHNGDLVPNSALAGSVLHIPLK